MDNITKYLNKISYKFPKGYLDVNIPEEKALLFEIAEKVIKEQEEEENLIDKLIDTIRASNLSDDELTDYIKSIYNRGFTMILCVCIKAQPFLYDYTHYII